MFVPMSPKHSHNSGYSRVFQIGRAPCRRPNSFCARHCTSHAVSNIYSQRDGCLLGNSFTALLAIFALTGLTGLGAF